VCGWVCSREIFNKWEAQRWWGENYDRVVELYNVQTFSRQLGVSTPSSSVDDATTQVRVVWVVLHAARLLFVSDEITV